MSNKALTWAFESEIDNVGAKFVLVALADHATDHAGEDWTCFPSNERLTAFTSMPMRTLERHLSWLFAEGWISRETPRDKRGRMKDRTYTLHREAEDRAGLKRLRAGGEDGSAGGETGACPPAKLAGGETADHPPKTGGSTRQFGGHHPPPVAGGYIAEPPEEPSGTLTQGARATAAPIDARAVFDRLPEAMRLGVSSFRQFEAAWMAEVRRGTDPAVLGPAVLAYGATRSAWGVSGRPKAAHRVIELGTWDAFTERASPGEVPAASIGPPGFRDALVDETDAGFAASYLDPCSWDAGRRVLTARTGVAFEKLAARCAAVFATFEVTLARPGAAGAARGVQLGETV